MPHAIVRQENGRRHEVDFGNAPIRVEIYASEETIEIFIEADLETLPEERRRFVLLNIPRQTSGQSWFFGDLIEGPSPERGLIFQETSLFPWLSVWQNVSFGLSIRGVDIAERKEI